MLIIFFSFSGYICFKFNIVSLTQGISISYKNVYYINNHFCYLIPLFLFFKKILQFLLHRSIVFYFCIVECNKKLLQLLLSQPNDMNFCDILVGQAMLDVYSSKSIAGSLLLN
uniref:Uncharacterized protein n=1 Tax=Sipha flava TaxID=143950 RepID=A0A2S2R805_9HEMI